MEFRFGVVLHLPSDRRAWIEKCRRAEDLGFDTVAIADHLGMPAPFPSLVLAAEATERVRLGVHMLNSNFYRPALAARDIATTDLLTDGRLELGLGAGHAKHEFEAAGLEYGTGGRRVDGLERMVAELRRLFADPETQPRPAQQPLPPLMIAGRGDRILTFAAREADIIAFNGASGAKHESGLPTLASAEATAERVSFTRTALGDRAGTVEFNSTAVAVVLTDHRRAALEKLEHFAPDLTVEERAEVPALLVGTVPDIAEKLRQNHERLNFTYITVMEESLAPMSKIIEHLK